MFDSHIISVISVIYTSHSLHGVETTQRQAVEQKQVAQQQAERARYLVLKAGTSSAGDGHQVGADVGDIFQSIFYMIWYDMIQYDMAWYGMIWYAMLWYIAWLSWLQLILSCFSYSQIVMSILMRASWKLTYTETRLIYCISDHRWRWVEWQAQEEKKRTIIYAEGEKESGSWHKDQKLDQTIHWGRDLSGVKGESVHLFWIHQRGWLLGKQLCSANGATRVWNGGWIWVPTFRTLCWDLHPRISLEQLISILWRNLSNVIHHMFTWDFWMYGN